jgi:hypothetical protein
LRTSDEGASASFARMCRIRLLAWKFVLTRTLCLICRIPFLSRIALFHALAKVSIELIEIYFHSFEIFIILIEEMVCCRTYYQVKLFSECSQKGECLDDDEYFSSWYEINCYTSVRLSTYKNWKLEIFH